MLLVHLLLIVLYSIEALAVLGMILLGADMAWWLFSNPEAKASREKKPEKPAFTTRVQNVVNVAREMQAERKARVDKRRKADLRAQKESEAWLGFDTAEYFCGFARDGALIYRGGTAPSGQDWEFFAKKQDKIADDAIFELAEGM
jgi:hypothetical protein